MSEFKGKFYSEEEISNLKHNSVNTASENSFGQHASEIASEIINAFDDVAFNENKSLAAKSQKVKIGEIFTHNSKTLVKTPYNTVVDAQIYINVLQDQLIAIGNLSSVALFKLTFKQLLNEGENQWEIRKNQIKAMFNNLWDKWFQKQH